MSRVDNAVLKISRRRLPKSFGAFLQQNRTASSIRPRNTAMCLTTISDVTWRRLMHSWRKPRIRRRLCFFYFLQRKKASLNFPNCHRLCVCDPCCKSFYAKRVSLNFRRFSVRDASSFIFSYRESFSEFLFFFSGSVTECACAMHSLNPFIQKKFLWILFRFFTYCRNCIFYLNMYFLLLYVIYNNLCFHWR